MQLGKYFWIWQLSECEGGNIAALIQRAKVLGLAGFIIKVNDGGRMWPQSQLDAIKQIKAAGLTCGAWGYSYCSNLQGDINAVKQAVALGTDFYVADIEGQYESTNDNQKLAIRNYTEAYFSAISKLGIPIGYTSYAIPNYHASVPFDIMSKYCSFTMPQIYWADMEWDLSKAFWTSLEQYKAFDIPVYPIGQTYDKATPADIQAFNKLCRGYGADVISYWDYQHATAEQLNATIERVPQPVQQPAPDEFTQNIIALKAAKIIDADSNHKADDIPTWAELAKVGAKLIK